MSTSAIHRNMIVRDIITLFPGAADIMAEYGLHCFSCSVGGVETLEEGCKIHGFEEEVVEALIEDLNEGFESQPPRPEVLMVTPEAAQGIANIAKAEGKQGWALDVSIDQHGGFCLEFCEKVPVGSNVFTAEGNDDVEVCASSLSLKRIGGATIDFREGRFTLDMVDDCCGGGEKGCDCSGQEGVGCGGE